MDCPACGILIDPALVMAESQRTLAARPRPGRHTWLVCPKCGRETTKRNLTRRPKCPHEPKRVSQKAEGSAQ